MKRCSAPSSRPTPRAEPLGGIAAVRTVKRAFALSWSTAAFVLLLACDRGVYVAGRSGEPLHVVGVSVGPDRPWRDGDPIVVAFDRYLDPRTATRQSLVVLDASSQPVANPLVIYDPETRTITLQNPSAGTDSWLLLDQPYSLLLGIPAEGQLLGGVRALDGGTLTPDQALRIPFFARARAAPTPTPPPPVSYCERIQPLLTRACARCHDGSISGLDLRSARGVETTARGHLARGAAQGGWPNPTPSTPRFGEGAALLDPPNAATSYLLAKVLAAPIGNEPSRAECTSRAQEELPPDVTMLPDPGDAERALLHSFLQGEVMPPPGVAEAPLSLHERRLLSRWIREGAALETCRSSCP